MNAIGLYYFSNSSGSNLKETEKKHLGINPQLVDLHINIWKVERGKFYLKPEIYIDFGIMSSFKVQKLCLYLPFGVKIYEDLGKILNNKKKELCAIFNDELLPKPQRNGCYCKIEYEEPKATNDFFLYELGEKNIEVVPQNGGTYVFITFEGYPNDKVKKTKWRNEKRYIRFRVKVEKREEISITSHISNDLLQAAFSMSDYYDIRVNEKREIPDKVKEYMQSKNFKICKFTKVHLFYMADSREKIENESSLKCDSRLLESCQWKGYEPKTVIYNPVFIAHHWKKRMKDGEDVLNNFSVFFNTIYPKLNILRLISYLSVAILLGCIGSILTNLNDENLLSEDLCVLIIIILFFYLVLYLVCTNFIFKLPRIFRKK